MPPKPAEPAPVWLALLQVAWPAFLGASVLELVVFAHVDPADVHRLSGADSGLPDQAIYTLAFFAFWVVVAGACLLAAALVRRDEP